MKRTKSFQAGFTLIEIMISLGLASLLALTVVMLQNFVNASRLKATNAFQANQFRKQIIAYLSDPTAWKATLLNNHTFDCITTAANCFNALNNGPPANDYSISSMTPDIASGSACLHGAASCHGGFDVYDNKKSGPVVFYNPASDSTRGFQLNGAQCANGMANGQAVAGAPGWIGVASGNMSVGSTSRSSLCPFRLVLWWVPVCPTAAATGACYSPAINVKGYLLYTPNPSDPYAKGAPDPAAYGLNIILPPNYQ